MNSRERLQTAFAHQRPDRCPTFIWINPDAMQQLAGHMGLESDEQVIEELEVDNMRQVSLPFRIPPQAERRIGELVPDEYRGREEYFVDELGRVSRIHEGSDYLEDTVWVPLQDARKPGDLDGYPLPHPDWVYPPADLEERIRRHQEQGRLTYAEVNQVFKAAWQLRGMDKVLMDFLVNPDLIDLLYARLYEFNVACCKPPVEAGIDVIAIVGDIAMQNSLMMSPRVWRQFARPRLAHMISTLKEINPELKIYMHSDGDLWAVLDDLVEVGVDILNPIQPECMSPAKVKEEYGDRLVLHGCMSLQRTLPFGSPEDVSREVEQLIRDCSGGGGFVLGPSNVLFKEIPPENIVAMYEAVKRYGRSR